MEQIVGLTCLLSSNTPLHLSGSNFFFLLFLKCATHTYHITSMIAPPFLTSLPLPSAKDKAWTAISNGKMYEETWNLSVISDC